LATISDVRLPKGTTGRDWVKDLWTNGYCIIPGLLPELKLNALYNDLLPHFSSAQFCTSDCYDGQSKRFGGLLGRSQHASAAVLHPLILEIARSILEPHCNRFHLNFTQAFEIWPGQAEQSPRRTTQLWSGLKVETECVVTAMWPFQLHCGDNSATFIWPESHRPPPGNIAAELAPISAQLDAGDVLLLLGSTLHSAKSNSTGAPWAGMNVSYSVGWLTPLENHWLTYTPQVAGGFSTELAGLIGYPQQRNDRDTGAVASVGKLLPDDIPGFYKIEDEHRPGFANLAEARLAPPPVDETFPESVVPRLRASYGLTNSEAEVGKLLLGGVHARQISKLRAVSIETVRSQIKRVYSKACVKSHSEFILHNRPLLPPLSGTETGDAHRDHMPKLRVRK
jgi:DNA-binding CsgD family transcriptional regulator